jgi:membrane associated rhomboid family serine protease
MFADRKKLVMCQVCRGLIEASAKTCPLCGRESVPRARLSTAGVNESGHFFSLVILTINIILFVLMAIVEIKNGGGGEKFIQSASSGVLNDFGALVPSLVRSGQWWRLVTFNFLHIGLMHLMFNSSALYSIGPQVESIFGSQKFVFAYLGTGIASAFASYLFLPNNTAGASGAIFGLIGLMAVYGYRQGGSFGRALMKQMLIWAAIGIMFGFFIGANNVAHIGGFVAGAVLGFVLKPDSPATSASAARWNAVAIACIGVVAISFAMAGKAYGAEQEKSIKLERISRRHQNAYELAQIVKQARSSVRESLNLNRQEGSLTINNAIQIAAQLHQVAADLEKASFIDDRSNEIKSRLIELINKRAKSFEEAKNEEMIMGAAMSDLEALRAAFTEFAAWESDAAQEFERLEKQ